MTKNELIKEAVRQGLDGGRKFGAEQHKRAFQYLAEQMADAAEQHDKVGMIAVVDALTGIANQSALQQQLDSAGLIDRVKKAEKRANIFADLKA